MLLFSSNRILPGILPPFCLHNHQSLMHFLSCEVSSEAVLFNPPQPLLLDIQSMEVNDPYVASFQRLS